MDDSRTGKKFARDPSKGQSFLVFGMKRNGNYGTVVAYFESKKCYVHALSKTNFLPSFESFDYDPINRNV